MRVLLRRKLCECGCGQVVAKGKRFRHGHNGRLLNNVEMERRRKISENLKVSRNTSEYKKYLSKRSSKMWESEEYREKHSKAMEQVSLRPEVSEKRSKRAKKMWDERKEELSQKIRIGNQKPSAKKKRSIASKRNHALGVYDRAIKKMLAYWVAPEHCNEKSEQAKQMWQNPEFRENFSRKIEAYYKTPESRQKISGENSGVWRGGISINPYSKEWTRALKKEIKTRDGFKCYLCGRDKKLCVHHVDYNKLNAGKRNLITLCRKCHSKTNRNRRFWIIRFNHLFVERGMNAS